MLPTMVRTVYYAPVSLWVMSAVALVASLFNSIVPDTSALALPDFITESVAVGAMLMTCVLFLKHGERRDERHADTVRVIMEQHSATQEETAKIQREAAAAHTEALKDLTVAIQKISPN